MEKLKVIGIFVGMFIIIASISAYFSQNSKSDSEYDTRSDKVKAWVVAESQIERSLKAPSTADFQSYNESNVIYQYNKGTYMVSIYVDAENSFGAKIREYFNIEVKLS